MHIFKKLAVILVLGVLTAGCTSEVDEVCGTTEVTLLAGSADNEKGDTDGIGKAARFSFPRSITTDGTNLYVADKENNKIRKIAIATAEVTTIAQGDSPLGLTTDGTYLYASYSDGNIVKYDILNGGWSPVVLGGTLTNPLERPIGMATDGTYLYVSDSETHTIYKVVIATGEVSTLAGSEDEGFADGIGTAARFDRPYGLELVGGDLYVADYGNNRIRKVVVATGEVTTLAGTGEDGSVDGKGEDATFMGLTGLVHADGALFVTDGLDHRVRKVLTATGEVKTLAGVEEETFAGPGDITAVGSLSDADGISFYVANSYGNNIKKIHHIPGECGDDTSTQASITGTVTGLTAKLVLQLNGGNDTTTVTENGSFTFEVASGTTYDISVKTQPNGQVCTVTNGSGTAEGAVTGVAVSCEASATPPSDATPPATPTIVDLTTVNRQPVLTGTYDAADAGGGFTVKVNGVRFTLGTDDELTASGNDWTLTMPEIMAVGVYDITATAADAAGNVASASGVLAIVEPPPEPTVTAVSSEDSTPTLSGTFDDANTTTFTVEINGVTYTMGTDAALITTGNSWNLTIPDAKAVAVGTYDVVATATDGSGNSKSDSTTDELVVTGTTATWSIEDIYTNDTTPTIRGTFPTDASGFTVALGFEWYYETFLPLVVRTKTDPEQGDVLLDIHTQKIVGTFDRTTGEWQLTSIPLEERTYSLWMSDSSPDTHSDYRTRPVAAAKLVVDLTAPTTQPTVDVSVSADGTPTITGTFDSSDAAGGLSVTVNGVTYTLDDPELTSSGDTWSLTIPAGDVLSSGTYDVVATVADSAGNSTSDASTDELEISSAVDVASQVQVTAGSESLVGEYRLTLKQDGSPVSMTGNPVTVTGAAPVSATFSSVPDGTNYTIEADAFASCGDSVATAPVTSAAFDIVSGAIVASGTSNPASTPVSMDLTLQSEFNDLFIQVNGGTSGSLAGFGLLNQADFSTDIVADTDTSPGFGDVTVNNVSAGPTTGSSHRLFYYFVNSSGESTVAKSQTVTENCAGVISSATHSLAYDMIQSPIVVVSSVPAPFRVGGFGQAWGFDTGQFVATDGDYRQASIGASEFAVAPIDDADVIFYFDPDNNSIYRSGLDTMMMGPEQLYSGIPSVTAIAADQGGAVYWSDLGDVWKLPAGATTATKIISSATDTVDDLTVDAFGNIYYLMYNGIQYELYNAQLGTANGTDYTEIATPLHTGPGIVPGTLSADAVGNLYFQDGSGTGNLKMIGIGSGGTVTDVKATSGASVSYPAVGADGTLFYLDIELRKM